MKKLIALLLAAVLVLGLCGCVTKPEADPTVSSKPGDDGVETTSEWEETTEEPTAEKKVFTVVVVHADGTSEEFTYETDEEFVGPVLEADGLIKGNEGPYGMEITEVDGEKAVYAENKAYWAVYEGEEYAMQGIDTTPAVDGGIYKLVYTIG